MTKFFQSHVNATPCETFSTWFSLYHSYIPFSRWKWPTSKDILTFYSPFRFTPPFPRTRFKSARTSKTRFLKRFTITWKKKGVTFIRNMRKSVGFFKRWRVRLWKRLGYARQTVNRRNIKCKWHFRRTVEEGRGSHFRGKSFKKLPPQMLLKKLVKCTRSAWYTVVKNFVVTWTIYRRWGNKIIFNPFNTLTAKVVLFESFLEA